MTLNLIPAVTAILLGLLASGAIDFADADGDTHAVAWLAFALALALVARGVLLGGTIPVPRNRSALRDLPVEVRDGDVRIRFTGLRSLEPVVTTLAILLGLLTSHAIDFLDEGGGASSWAWTVFALALFLTLGGRIGPRQRRRRHRERERMAGEMEARIQEIIDTIDREIRRRFSTDQ